MSKVPITGRRVSINLKDFGYAQGGSITLEPLSILREFEMQERTSECITFNEKSGMTTRNVPRMLQITLLAYVTQGKFMDDTYASVESWLEFLQAMSDSGGDVPGLLKKIDETIKEFKGTAGDTPLVNTENTPN